jgi:redox-sensitive bicupin YhaK (pirin superfamily)
VIQIWFLVPLGQRGLAPHYEQVKLEQMPSQQAGDGIIREIIGPGGATESHVEARLTSTLVPANGQTVIQVPQPGEDLFLYVTDGGGQILNSQLNQPVGLYDVVLARPQAEATALQAGDKPLNFLSFYLKSFLGNMN